MNKRLPVDTGESEEQQIQNPAIITPLHVQDRETSKVAGAPRAWRKLSQIENAYKQERLGEIGSNDALKRFDAGNTYADLFDCSQRAGRDSTAGFDVGRSMGSGLPLTEAQARAIQRLIRTEMRLGENDRTIVRAVCAWGYSPKEAIALAKLPNDTRVSARLCEALDTLAIALEYTQKRVTR
jgi:hypothetical protein